MELVRTREANTRAVTKVNPIRPRDVSWKTASLPKMVKPATGEGVQREHYITGLSGVVGDSAQGKIRRGTWETRRYGTGDWTNRPREYITVEGCRPGVGEAHSSEEASNDRGAKEPHRSTLM